MTLNMKNYKGYDKKPYCNAWVQTPITLFFYMFLSWLLCCCYFFIPKHSNFIFMNSLWVKTPFRLLSCCVIMLVCTRPAGCSYRRFLIVAVVLGFCWFQWFWIWSQPRFYCTLQLWIIAFYFLLCLSLSAQLYTLLCHLWCIKNIWVCVARPSQTRARLKTLQGGGAYICAW